MFKKAIVLGLFVVLVIPVAGYAQDNISSDTGQLQPELFREEREVQRQTMDAAQEETKQQMDQNRETLRKELEAIREDADAGLLMMREARKEVLARFMEQRREALQRIREAREAFRERLQEMRDAVKERVREERQELRDGLGALSDERKKQLSEHIFDQLNELNQRLATHFGAVLNQIEDVLDRVRSRTDKAEANGIDVALVRGAITNAENAIVSAREAVVEQAGKTYTFDVDAEETLRVDVEVARRLLHDDLVGVRELIRTAHDMVRRAAVALAQIPGVDSVEVEDADGTASSSTSSSQ